MAGNPHLLVDISSHGYGHASMTAPVLNELAQLVPDLRITVRCGLSEAFLRGRTHCDFHYIQATFDFGMRMHSAVEVDVEQSAVAYREFHRDWPGRVTREAEAMRILRPDLLLANVPYLSLAAAKLASVRAIGLCCLNWADFYRHYYLQDVESDSIHAQMLQAYSSAERFLRVQPAMPMAELGNVKNVGPIARLGNLRRAEINVKIPQAAEERLVLVAMGGMEFRLPVEQWPHLPGVRWLVPQDWRIEREDVSTFESLGMTFSDTLASCDAVLTKPGYATFTEAACNGIPVLYVTRGDWPEESYLVQWLQRNGRCIDLEREKVMRGELRDALAQLWAMPRPVCPQPAGAVQTAQLLREILI